MRITEHRYARDLRRYHLAWQLIHHEVRTGTIRAWTDLSGNRIRTLYNAYMRGQGKKRLPRHRGVSPFQPRYFVRSERLKREAACLGAICRLLNVLPERPISNAAQTLPSLARGELLLRAFELHRLMTPKSKISFERAVLLLFALAEAKELALDTCASCGAIIIFDYLSVPRTECSTCRSCGQLPDERSGGASESTATSAQPSLPQQAALFD